MANPTMYAGLDMLDNDELDNLRVAINNEILARKKKAKAEGLSSNLATLMKCVLGDGFSIIIETAEDEIEVLAENADMLSVTVYPAV